MPKGSKAWCFFQEQKGGREAACLQLTGNFLNLSLFFNMIACFLCKIHFRGKEDGRVDRGKKNF